MLDEDARVPATVILELSDIELEAVDLARYDALAGADAAGPEVDHGPPEQL